MSSAFVVQFHGSKEINSRKLPAAHDESEECSKIQFVQNYLTSWGSSTTGWGSDSKICEHHNVNELHFHFQPFHNAHLPNEVHFSEGSL